jgi:hypothetical protein
VTPELEGKLDRAYRVTVILTVAMIVSVFLYAGIVEILPRLAPSGAPPMEPDTVEILRQIFRGLALVNFLSLAFLGKRAHRAEGEAFLRLARLKSLTTVRLALAESIALYGLVLFVMSRDPMDFHYLLLVSLLSFIVVFPRRDRWREALSGNPTTP